jgi:NAD(P)H-flavin reductase
MPDLFPARVVSVRPDAESQTFLVLDTPRDLWTAHIQPAQYVDFVLPDLDPWRGTIASRPGRETFDFLVKNIGPRSARIAALAPGDEVQLTRPAGDGFPILAHRSMDILMIATGVAICAMRAVIEEILLARSDWGRVMLFYGERTADRFALIEERERWRESGIEVFLTASRPSAGTYWQGHTGYVQDHLSIVEPEVRNAVAFLAGKDGMLDDTSVVLERLGLPRNRMLVNV